MVLVASLSACGGNCTLCGWFQVDTRTGIGSPGRAAPLLLATMSVSLSTTFRMSAHRSFRHSDRGGSGCQAAVAATTLVVCMRAVQQSGIVWARQMHACAPCACNLVCVGEMHADSRICASSGLWLVVGNCWSCAVLASLQSSGSAGAGSSSWAHRYLPVLLSLGLQATVVMLRGWCLLHQAPMFGHVHVWPHNLDTRTTGN